jgi:hypothetical protein
MYLSFTANLIVAPDRCSSVCGLGRTCAGCIRVCNPGRSSVLVAPRWYRSDHSLTGPSRAEDVRLAEKDFYSLSGAELGLAVSVNHCPVPAVLEAHLNDADDLTIAVAALVRPAWPLW